MNNLMMSVAGIRGIVGESLTPEIALNLTLAFSTIIKKGPVVIGTDTRPSREYLSALVTGGLLGAGRSVHNLGIAPTPTVGFAVRKLNASGGIALTASHNPEEWNALKLFNAHGRLLAKREFEKLLRVYNKRDFKLASAQNTGSVAAAHKILNHHVDAVVEHCDTPSIQKRSFKVVVDCCNGAGLTLIPQLLDRFGCRAVIMNADAEKPFPHNPEPLPENLSQLRKRVIREKADIGFALDPDADRLAIVDENGKPLSEERTIVLAAYYVLSRTTTPLVVNLSTTQAVECLAERFGVKTYRTPIGEAHVVEKMLSVDAAIGGEGNGGVIFPAIQPGRDAAAGMGLILSLMARENLPISEINNRIPTFTIKKAKIKLPNIPVEIVFDRIQCCFPEYRAVRKDGLKLIAPDRWIHVRPSSTEPIMRIFVEAPTSRQAASLRKQISECIGGVSR